SLWQVGVRAEVYSLALLTNLWGLDAALRARQWAETSPRRAISASVEVALALSLGLLNHHYIAIFQLPALLYAGAPALRIVWRTRPAALAIVAVGLFAGLGYLYLPLRALSGAEMRWADPTSAAGVWDSVTARHFQRAVSGADVDVLDNLVRLLSMVVEGTGIWLGLAGLLGLVLSVRMTSTRGVVLMLSVLGALLTKALMQIDANNPDDHGYVLMAPAGLALGIANLGGLLFGPHGLLAKIQADRRRRLALLIVPWVLVLVVLSGVLRTTSSQTWQADQHGSDWVDDLTRRKLAPGAIYLSNYYGLQFNEAAWRVAEGRRPDLVSAHLSFRTGDTDGGRGYARWFAHRHPDEMELSRAAQALGKAPIGNILQRAETQSVFAEQDPDLRLPPSFFSFAGIANRLLPSSERSLEYNLQAIQKRQDQIWSELYTALGPVKMLDHQTRSILMWQHALQMAHALRRGWRLIAHDEFKRALVIGPNDRLLQRLKSRLELLDGAWNDGDVARFHRLWRGYASMDFDALVDTSP
ncbi:MAG: hypothetical protein CMH53_10680, partial [Myxococcales bacterium]|nr:hypothetical protein [Myxococcales bacterium]